MKSDSQKMEGSGVHEVEGASGAVGDHNAGSVQEGWS